MWKWDVNPFVADRLGPVGVRDENGSIVSFSPEGRHRFAVKEAQYSGRPETVPMCIGQLVG